MNSCYCCAKFDAIVEGVLTTTITETLEELIKSFLEFQICLATNQQKEILNKRGGCINIRECVEEGGKGKIAKECQKFPLNCLSP